MMIDKKVDTKKLPPVLVAEGIILASAKSAFALLKATGSFFFNPARSFLA
jgi:hypothetical protein